MAKACGHADCGVSTGICGAATFGRGELDVNGYWDIPCDPCARRWEKRHPFDGHCWPPASKYSRLLNRIIDSLMEQRVPFREATNQVVSPVEQAFQRAAVAFIQR